ncbi:hypothetical protein ACUL41_17660 [Virgibacillus natechei]|uniref:hypothetical protein n=1 Tax=Virgibacillus sp. CBA3643 TaxID=2942278 RepID=UPI0035A33804
MLIILEQKRKAPFKNVEIGAAQLRLDELDLSPVMAKVKVNLMLGKRKGIMPLQQGYADVGRQARF